MTAKVYIHEFVDITGHNRARYMQHITANWSPIGQEERNQLCYGIWGTVGSTASWPEVINMWEFDGWEGLAGNLNHELSSPTLQDPALAEWWAQAESLRRGGFDRIMVAAPWCRSITQLVEQGVRGALYAHELVRVPPGKASDLLRLVETQGRALVESEGAELVGAFRTAMSNDSECLLLWAFPDWDTWARFEQAWEDVGALVAWRDALIGLGATWQRFLLVDAPLSPMRIGRQPEVSDRRPLSEV
ncbi:MAG TPA: hypothetical protein VGH66_07575 [Acidimicrobiales bacterium]|jgi:hypothetical protein